MTGNEYQDLAMRTCSIPYNHEMDRLRHAVFGINSESQEFEDAFGACTEEGSKEHVIKELGDITWMVAEFTVASRLGMDTEKKKAEESAKRMRVEYIDVMHATREIRRCAAALANILQKEYQGHAYSAEDIRVIAEKTLLSIATVAKYFGKTLDDVMETNIKKLKARYPEGFSAFRSKNRAEGDV